MDLKDYNLSDGTWDETFNAAQRARPGMARLGRFLRGSKEAKLATLQQNADLAVAPQAEPPDDVVRGAHVIHDSATLPAFEEQALRAFGQIGLEATAADHAQ